jgi:hypothetical protein
MTYDRRSAAAPDDVAYDRRTAAESPTDKAKTLAAELLQEFGQYELGALNGAIGERVAGVVERVKHHAATLEAALKAAANQPNEKAGRLVNDAIFVLNGQVDLLHKDLLDWTEKLGAVNGKINGSYKSYKKLAELCQDAHDWSQPKVKELGTKSLSGIKFEVAEVSRGDVSFKSYRTKLQQGTFRIAPADLSAPGNAWVVDSGGMAGWEKFIPETFRSPAAAASALAAELPFTT